MQAVSARCEMRSLPEGAIGEAAAVRTRSLPPCTDRRPGLRSPVRPLESGLTGSIRSDGKAYDKRMENVK
jgi:hypothetical protein